VILGYLVSGFAIGPFGFKLLSNVADIKSLAEIGVAFLLFALGVEFSLADLKRVKQIAIKGSLLQIGLTIALVAIVTVFTGWASGITQGIFLGAVLSLSSTAIVLKTLTESGETNTVHGQIMLAILIAQDLANAFKEVDVLISPTSPTTAWGLGERVNNPMAMYLADLATLPPSLAGIPAMSVPIGLADEDKLPVGLQIVAPFMNDDRMYRVGGAIEASLKSKWNGLLIDQAPALGGAK
jgi:predicted Kef-type K+ transport protein